MLPTTKLLSTTPEALVALSQSHSRLSSVAARHYANPLSTYSTPVAQPCADSESIIYSRNITDVLLYSVSGYIIPADLIVAVLTKQGDLKLQENVNHTLPY
nr:hypothetical protein Iba_chr14cCG6710 [Ipomoea batatas]